MAVRVEVGTDVIAEGGYLDALAHEQIGAVVQFYGIVRKFEDSDAPLVLEHYPGMTEKSLVQIAERAVGRFALDDAVVLHRVGAMHPGEIIVMVLAASKHRKAAFEGAAYIMDYLKTDAPFWKKEGEKWVDARESDYVARVNWG